MARFIYNNIMYRKLFLFFLFFLFCSFKIVNAQLGYVFSFLLLFHLKYPRCVRTRRARIFKRIKVCARNLEIKFPSSRSSVATLSLFMIRKDVNNTRKNKIKIIKVVFSSNVKQDDGGPGRHVHICSSRSQI